MKRVHSMNLYQESDFIHLHTAYQKFLNSSHKIQKKNSKPKEASNLDNKQRT